MSPLRVGMNLMWLRPSLVGGTEEYACRLIEALAACAADDDDEPVELALFAPRTLAAAHPELVGLAPMIQAPVSGANRVWRVATEATWLGARARDAHVGVLHHLGGTVAPNTRLPAVVTLHDLQYLNYPDYFSLVKLAWLRDAVPRAMRKAAVVTTPTDFVRDEVLEHFAVSADRVITVPYAYPAKKEPDFDRPRQPLFVYPVIPYPHKNHVTLLRAFAKVRGAHPDARLSLPGGLGPCEAEIRAEIGSLGLDGCVERRGRIARAELDEIIATATALVYPSRYEGFGLSVLEAMAAGCPVIAADATALSEVGGPAAVLVDPDDVDGWAAAMLRLLEDPAEWSARARAARTQALRYTPAESARRARAAYRLAVA